MKWLPLDEVLARLELPVGYSFRKIGPEDVYDFTNSLRSWYPDIQVGSESRFLRPEFYFKNIFVGENGDSDAGNFYPLMCMIDGEIAGWLILEKNDDGLTISCPMAGLVPSFRQSGAGVWFSRLLELMGRAIGAEMAYVVVTLKVQGSQRIIEKNGFKLVGILPAFDRDMVEPGRIKRVFEAMYAKVLVGEDKILQPDEEAMTPQTKALFDFIFKKEVVTNANENRGHRPALRIAAESR